MEKENILIKIKESVISHLIKESKKSLNMSTADKEAIANGELTAEQWREWQEKNWYILRLNDVFHIREDT